MREPDRQHKRAKSLRRTMSLPEVLLWRARLCVEVDGYAHGTDDRPARDDRRDAYLAREGVHVERIAARSVLDDPHAVAPGVRDLAAQRIAAGV